MRLTDLLTVDRVGVRRANGKPFERGDVLSHLAGMLAAGTRAPVEEIHQVLMERETLQSTGVGEGVAIPHGAVPELTEQCAAILIVPDGVEFGAIDNGKVNIFFAVIGPKRASGEHLKTLARVSRLLRNREFRKDLLASASGVEAFQLISREEREGQ